MSSQGSAVATGCSAATLGGTTERAELISQQRASSIAAASTAQGPDRSSSLCPAAGLAAAGAGVWGCHTKLSIFHSGARRAGQHVILSHCTEAAFLYPSVLVPVFKQQKYSFCVSELQSVFRKCLPKEEVEGLDEISMVEVKNPGG